MQMTNDSLPLEQSSIILEQKERKIVTHIAVIFLNLDLYDSSTLF